MLIFESWIVDLYNRILIESFSIVLDTYAHDLTVVNIAPTTPFLNALLVLSITFISALICVLMLHKLKPIEIIRAKDNGGEVS
jgi:ABC-type antimicrobial peptide transport system permease subunit